ncbi:MAG: adenylate/guanylate cyclase domain-containing protein [Candidatus Tectomicrobia bacterium]
MVNALTGAVAIQHDLTARNEDLPDERKLRFRIGINLGDVIVDRNEIYGDGVNVAARLESLAEPGGICISDMVRQGVEGKLDLDFEDLGEQSVKNIEKPVRVYQARLKPGAVLPEPSARPKTRRPMHHVMAATAVAVVLVIGVGVIAWFAPWTPTTEPASQEGTALPLPDKPSIAVLPFTNMSGDAKQEYLSDGITESLITRLAQQPDMFVIARTSSFTYKGKPVKVQQIGRELGVRHVLEGSIQKAGERLRITAQLIEAATGKHLWAESYDRELKDIFAVQDEITRKVAVELAVKLVSGERARIDFQATDNVQAYDHFLRGVEAYRRFEKGTNVQAGKLFEKAIELDPQFARAYGYLGWVRMNEFRWEWGENPEQSLEQAEALARRGIAIRENPPSYNVLARVHTYQRQYEQAIAAGERSMAIEPNEAGSHASFAWTMSLAGRPEDSVASMKKALRLSPYPPNWYLNVDGWANYLTGRYAAAITSCNKLLSRTTKGGAARGCWRLLIANHMALGQDSEARTEAQKFLKHYPNFSLKSDVKWIKEAFKDSSWVDRYVERLRKAGLPE